MTVLIVEDETIAARALECGYDVVGVVGTGKGAIELARSQKPELVLMDIMLKDHISGVDAAVEICHLLPRVKVIFLTAYAETEMIQTAIEANTVGYFLKPYNREEILVNLKILAADKNTHATPQTASTPSTILELAEGFSYDTEQKRLYRNQQEVYLSAIEQKAIECLCKNPCVIIDFNTLIEHIWQEKKPQQRLRSLISRLRKKTSYSLLTNVNKYGYKIALKESHSNY